MNRARVSPSPIPPPANAGAAAPGAQPPVVRTDALPPGTRLEQCIIERVIGASSFGIVYAAFDESTQHRVAIKEYLPDTLALRAADGLNVELRATVHADAFERGRCAFVGEAQLLQRRRHPSLLQVLAHWSAHDTVYRSMPFYGGSSLLSLRQAMASPPDEASLRALLDGLLGAIETLHEAGSLHREIAPSNILLQPDDRPILMDSAAVRRAVVGDQARALMRLLEPSFAPIEQTSPSPERPQGPWTDLYSLGAVLRFCISGKLPPPSSLHALPQVEPMAVLVRRMQERFPLIHYSASFLTAIDAALAVGAEHRPHSVAEFRARLEDHPPSFAPYSESDADTVVFGTRGQEPTLGESAWTKPAEEPVPSYVAPPVAPPPVRADVAPPPVRAEFAPPPVRSDSAPPVQAHSTWSRDEPHLGASSFAMPPPRYEPDPFGPGSEDLGAIPGRGGGASNHNGVFNFAEAARRRRRRRGWAIAISLLLAAGAAAWLVDQQRLTELAQSTLARAMREEVLGHPDKVTPAIPTEPEPTGAVTSLAGEAPRAPVSDMTAPNTTAATAPVAPGAAQSVRAGNVTQPAAQAPAQLTGQTPAPAAPAAMNAQPGMPAAANGISVDQMSRAAAAERAAGNRAATNRGGADRVATDRLASDRGGRLNATANPIAPPQPVARGDTTARMSSGAAQSRQSLPSAPPPNAQPPREQVAVPPEMRVTSPREACGDRTQFSLYRCMQSQCATGRWMRHPQCIRLRETDEVD